MRDQITKEQAEEFLRAHRIDVDVHALKLGGVLAGTGPYYSRASVEQYALSRASRAGEFYRAVIHYSMYGSTADTRRFLGATSTEGEDGHAVPTVYSTQILAPLMAPIGILGRCFRVVTPANNFTTAIDRVADHDDSAGITAKFHDELEEIEQSKVRLETVTARLHKLTAILPVTDELFEDAPGLGAYVQRKAPRKIQCVAEDNILRSGTGVGRPLAILNSPSLITVDPETGQAAGTIVAANVAKGKSRLAAHLHGDAVAIIHPDLTAQLPLLGNVIYQPGDADAPNGRLLSSPILVSESCEAPGTPGDLIWAALSEYLLLVKEPALPTITSLHCWFDRDIGALKFRFRFDGMPLWAQAFASRVGNPEPLTRSPFVVIAARAG